MTATQPQHNAARRAKVVAQLIADALPADSANTDSPWSRRIQWLDRIVSESVSPPPLSIALVGGSGAGKSMLINAVLSCHLLPVSVLQACTAAVTEIGYADGPRYSCKVEFISKNEWQREVEHLWAELDSHVPEAADPDEVSAAQLARNRLWAVYKPTDDSDPADFDPFNLPSRADVDEALSAGQISFENADPQSLRKRLLQYLDARHRFWPIVRRVEIRGPFKPLRGGVTLVDLPGLNDPNAAREAVTRQHLRSSRFVWVVFNIKRVLTAEMIRLIQGEDFLRQILMDGRANALTFVATACDDIDPDLAREEFALPDSASDLEIIDARNQKAAQVVRRQMKELARGLARRAVETPVKGERLATALGAAPVYTVSALESLRLEGHGRARAGVMQSPTQTAIPDLRRHLISLSSNHDPRHWQSVLEKQIDLLLDEARADLKARRELLQNKSKAHKEQMDRIRRSVAECQQELQRGLDAVRGSYLSDIQAGEEVLSERLRHSTDKARQQVELVINRWDCLHAATLKAIIKGGGVFRGKGGKYDFGADLTKPILDDLCFAWSEFFADRLTQALQVATGTLRSRAETYGVKLAEIVAQMPVSPEARQSLVDLAAASAKLLDEQTAAVTSQVQRQIGEVGKELQDNIPREITAALTAVIKATAETAGKGAKQAIIVKLGAGARKIANDTFAEIRESVRSGVRELLHTLDERFKETTELVCNRASVVTHNLSVNSSGDSQQDTDAVLKTLKQLDQALGSSPASRRPPAIRDGAAQTRSVQPGSASHEPKQTAPKNRGVVAEQSGGGSRP